MSTSIDFLPELHRAEERRVLSFKSLGFYEDRHCTGITNILRVCIAVWAYGRSLIYD